MTNKLPNPGFEVDASDWVRQSSSTSTITRDTTNARTGAASGRVDTTAATYVSSGINSVPVNPGATVDVDAWLIGNAGSVVAIAVVFMDASSATLSTSTGPDVPSAQAAWQLQSWSAVAPAGAAYARLRLYQRTASATSFWVDDASLTVTPALAATPRPEFYGVALQVDGAPAGPVTITRRDQNGAAPVRLLADQEPISGALSVVDYEPALVGTIAYDLMDADGTVVTVATQLDVQAAVLTAVTRPQYQATGVVVAYGHRREQSAVVHRPLGRSDPIVVGDVMRSREGQLSIETDALSDAIDLEDVAATGSVVQLRQSSHPGMDLYLVATGTSVDVANDDVDPVAWATRLQFVQVANPVDPLQGSQGWNFGTITAYGTFAELLAAFPTMRALREGP